ncbi:tetratricopeptide repeat protein [bacterium SCSIO 12741]|nr:tetratricopeptide repeat protein [bacterium SCSIO 12741]
MKNQSQNLGKIAVLLLAVLLYAQTLNYDFVLDDKIVITNNSFTKKGIDGIGDLFTHDSMTGFFGKDKNLVSGGRYRPLSMTMHALEWEFFGNSPGVYHFFNILLYALTGLMLFLILSRLIPPEKGLWFLAPAFIITAIFLANPLHTEVVANIKSRDEILGTFLALTAFYYVLRFFEKSNWIFLGASGFLFFLSLLSKESSVVFAGFIPLITFILLKDLDKKKWAMASGTLILATLIYIGMRYQILGSAKTEIAKEWMNNPFLYAEPGEKLATIFHTLSRYLYLLVIPHPLTHDYYPAQIPIYGWGEWTAWLGLISHLCLIGVFVWGVIKRNIWAIVSGIYLGGIVLYSNLLFPIGTFMNERFLYLPVLSIGFVGVFFLQKIKAEKLRAVVFLGIVIAYSIVTWVRNPAWETDATLALTDVEVSTNSAKCNMSAGLALIDEADIERNPTEKARKLNQAINYLHRSLEIYPTYMAPMLLSGNAYTGLKDYASALVYYENCLKMTPGYSFAMTNLEYVGQEATADGKFAEAEKAYLLYLQYDPKNGTILEKIGELYGKNMNKPEQAISYLEKAYQIDPQNKDYVQKLGVAHALLGHLDQAIEMFNQGIKLDPDNARLWLNLGVAYANQGKTEQSNACYQKAFEIDPSLKTQ